MVPPMTCPVVLASSIAAGLMSIATLTHASDSAYGPQYGQYPGYEANGPAASKDDPAEIPPLSLRIDPLNWLLFGRLGLELEVGLWEFVSLETVPVFVTSESPPLYYSLRTRNSELTQHSNGWGPLAGASIGVGFWLRGEAFKGNVIRLELTNYAVTYKATDPNGVVDEVSHTERRFVAYFGNAYRFGVFTIMTAIGLGYELNEQVRCFNGPVATTDCGNLNSLDIKLDPDATSVANLNGSLAPVYLTGRISFGVAF
jgi:hypothetical protein